MLTDDNLWRVPCPNCPQVVMLRIRELRRMTEFTCRACGQVSEFDNRTFARHVEAQQTNLRSVQESISRTLLRKKT